MLKRIFWCVGIGLLGVAVAAAGAQDVSVGAALRSLASRAENAFVGQVVSITRKGGVVEVVFRVDQNVMGNGTGATFTLREWAGLWPVGMQRYWVGERAMVFVQAASAAGLSSPVDGAEGVVPVVMAGDGSAPQVDVRRLATRVQRSLETPLASVAVSAFVPLQEAAAVAAAWREPTWKEPGVPVAGTPHRRSPVQELPAEGVPARGGVTMASQRMQPMLEATHE
ncbi:MAG: hypothetical protein PW792_13815 [Acidobacteriaceae bacterium]|nr:hypothetical protein [Acidobacteriaceae bacterium]